MLTNDYLQARAEAKNRKYKEDYAAVGTAFARGWTNSSRVSFSPVSLG